MGATAHSAGQSQFTPPPLVKEFAGLLNLYANIKNLLDGFFEAVKVVVDQSCQREDRITFVRNQKIYK